MKACFYYSHNMMQLSRGGYYYFYSCFFFWVTMADNDDGFVCGMDYSAAKRMMVAMASSESVHTASVPASKIPS